MLLLRPRCSLRSPLVLFVNPPIKTHLITPTNHKTQVSCIVTYATNSTCGFTDVKCLCGDKDYNSHVTACVKARCTVKESLSTRLLYPKLPHGYKTDCSCLQPLRMSR